MKCIAIVATTVDGRIALDSDHFSDWTSPEDKKFMREMLGKSDVIVVGRKTYKTAEKPLSKRNCIVMTSSIPATERRSENLLLWNPSGASHESVLQQYNTVALLGGTKTYSWFLEQGLIDELYLTIEPIVFGRGLPLFDTSKPIETRFKLASVRQMNDAGAVLLHYVKT